MKMIILRCLIILILPFAIPCIAVGSQNQSITPEFSKQLAAQIRTKTLQMKKKYSGFEFTEDTTAETFHSESGELQDTTRVLLAKRTYHQKQIGNVL